MIIKTNSDEETKRAQWLRGAALKRDWVTDCTIVPFGIDGVFVTTEKAKEGPITFNFGDREESNYVAVICGRGAEDIDKVLFEDVPEAWEYARLVAKEAGLPEDAVDGDIFERSSEDESESENGEDRPISLQELHELFKDAKDRGADANVDLFLSGPYEEVPIILTSGKVESVEFEKEELHGDMELTVRIDSSLIGLKEREFVFTVDNEDKKMIYGNQATKDNEWPQYSVFIAVK
ncbi:hypothetical protein DFP93_103174 [Aneurinibacillus soli]|uniref:Uncharacterized protein n=1 Tax=Aneurinibacillus soli TaxID=1500254 RepID=A0A0U5B2Z1_9BACL|nr:hypothetical protein [Aneurinibacillus soli]PYE62963.1 hypothetical protein DFP93_103174 [Aneurinibacillus soli]BAU28978.1 hypothetical protein CB4_03156 [Aneurinibacillus soli]